MKYDAYDFDHLNPGERLKIEHSIYLKQPEDIGQYIGYTVDELQTMRQESANKEDAIFQKLRKAVGEWEAQAAETLSIVRAIQYLRTPPVKHTANQWQTNEYGTRSEISNMVYQMSYNVYEQTKYNRETKQSEPVAWYVSWDVWTNSPNHTHIAGQSRKRYTDKAAADKYLQGRIKAYAHMFTEISPTIPKEYIQNFMVNGQLLPGYTIEQ